MMNWFLQGIYDSDFLNIAVCGVRDAEGRREEFDNAVPKSTGKDYIDSIVDILGRYFANDDTFKNFEVMPEDDKREPNPDANLYKMSEMIPMAPEGVKYWNEKVENIESDVAKNHLFIFKTDSGYKTKDMITKADIEKMKAAQAAFHQLVDTRKQPTQVTPKAEEVIVDGDYREVKPEEEKKNTNPAPAKKADPTTRPTVVSTETVEKKPADPAESLAPTDDKPEKLIEFNGFFEKRDVWPGDTVVANAPSADNLRVAVESSGDPNTFLENLDKLIVDKTTNQMYLNPARTTALFGYLKQFPELTQLVAIAMKLNKYVEFGSVSYPTPKNPDAHLIMSAMFYNNDASPIRECYIDPNDILGNGYNLVTKRNNHSNIYTETYVPFSRADIITKMILGKLEKSDYLDIARCYPRSLGDILQRVRLKNSALANMTPDSWRKLIINISKIITSMPNELFFNLVDLKSESDFKLTVRQPDWQAYIDNRFIPKTQQEAANQLNSRLGYMNDNFYVWFHPYVDNSDKDHEYHVYTNSQLIYFDPYLNYKKKFDKTSIEEGNKNKTSQKKVEKSVAAPQVAKNAPAATEEKKTEEKKK